jgi:peptide/nickel transport system substrate-binding protein
MITHKSIALRTAAAIIAAGVAIALAGCSSSSSNPTASGTPSGGIAQIAATADAQPQGIIAPRAGNLMWRQLVFEELVQLDPKTLQPQPMIATSWKLSDDQKTLTMKLRDDVTFHTGRKMDSSDVVYSIQQAMLPVNGVQLLKVAQQFTNVQATGANEVTITFATPLPTVFDLLDQVPIIDQQTFAQSVDGSKVIGTGPFMWKSWTPGGSLTLQKYAGYRDANKVKLDGVQLSIITDSTAQIAALKSDRTQLAYGLTITDALAFQNNPNFTLDTSSTINQMMGLNSAAPSLSNQKVRQAIYYAIDRGRINKQLFGGLGDTTDLLWPTGDSGYDKNQAHEYSYNLDKAKQLLKDAGSPTVSFTMTVPAYPIQQSMFEIIQNNLDAVGIKVTANVVDSATFNKMKTDNNTGEAFLDLGGALTPANAIDNLNALRPTGNLTGLNSAQYKALADTLRTAAAGSDHDAATKAMAQYILDQAVLQTIVRSPTLLPRNNVLQNPSYNVQGYLLLNHAHLQQ